MPAISRAPHKFVSKGIDLTNPPDLLAPGLHPRLINAVVEQAGALDCRIGSATIASGLGARGHSLARLNNLNPDYSALDHILLAGFDGNLYSGDPPDTLIASGFSGNPLSIITYRPDQSTAAWAYIADQNRMVKVDVNSTVRNIGIRSPSVPPAMEVFPPNLTGANLTGAWANAGTAGATSFVSRVPALTTIQTILYDSGVSGWACINPTTPTGDYSWLHAGERLLLNGVEPALIHDVLLNIPATTITSILYDSGATGPCSINLASFRPDLQRNSLIQIDAEVVRVLSASTDTLGNVSIRCSTAVNHVAGASVIGLISIRIFALFAFVAGDTIGNITTVEFTCGGAGTGTETTTAAQPPLGTVEGRALDASDYMVFAVWLSDPALLTSGRILIDVDSTTNDFAHNYYYFTFTPGVLNSFNKVSLGDGQYTQLFIRIRDLTRIGTDTTRDLNNAMALRFEITSTAAITARFDDWFVMGSFGPDVPSGSPTGIYYFYRYRSTATGARSNPSPAPRYQLYPSRTAIFITCTASTDPQVDVIDIFRYDPNLQSANTTAATIVYIATIPNSAPTYDDQNVASLIAANQQLETNLFQPWPVLAAPLSGTCNVSGNTVQWVSGDQFPLDMVPGTVITLFALNTKDNHSIYSFPVSATSLQILDNGGSGTNVPFNIYSPLLTGQPLPILFGPLEGPLATYTFGLGDPANPGTLYWTNGNDPDTASDQNTIEISSPSEPLIGGCVWNTLVYVFSRERCFLVRPSFDASGSFTFTFYALAAPSGLWSAWAVCAGIDGIYFLGRDGVYKIAGESVASISDQTLYPLFPHSGRPGDTVNDYRPVEMSFTNLLRMQFVAGDIWFTFADTGSIFNSFKFDRAVQGWFPHYWTTAVTSLYWEPTPQTAAPRLLMTSGVGTVLQATGTTDDGIVVTGVVRTPSMDFGDPRSQKLYVDVMTDLYSTAATVSVIPGADNFTAILPTLTLPVTPVRQQQRIPIASLASGLALYRNLAIEYQFNWGTRLFESEPAGYIQPYLGSHFISRGDQGFPDWQCLRDALVSVISTADITFTIDIDGTQSAYTLASTAGSLRKVYQILRHASKGRIFIWQLDSPAPFALFTNETIVRTKSWTGDMIDVKPFQGAEPG